MLFQWFCYSLYENTNFSICQNNSIKMLTVERIFKCCLLFNWVFLTILYYINLFHWFLVYITSSRHFLTCYSTALLIYSEALSLFNKSSVGFKIITIISSDCFTFPIKTQICIYLPFHYFPPFLNVWIV